MFEAGGVTALVEGVEGGAADGVAGDQAGRPERVDGSDLAQGVTLVGRIME